MNNFIISAFGDEIADDLRTQMDVLSSHDIKYIEMRGVNGKALVQHTLEEVYGIKQELDKRGFRISAIGSPIGKINITDDFQPHLSLFRHTVEIAKILEAQFIRMFSFFIPNGADPAVYRDEVIHRWNEFIRTAEGAGLVLLHENEKEIYGDTPERCLELMETLNCSFLKAVFDPANFVQCGVEPYPYAFDMLKGHIGYVHVKDALYSDHSVVPAGYGDGKLKEILTALMNNGYGGFLSLEPHLGVFTGFAELEHNTRILATPGDGPGKFAIAAGALKDIIEGLSESHS